MLNQEKIRLMTRLAILEKQHGRQIRRAENEFRADMLTNPVWKMGFLVTLLFAAAACIAAVFNMDMILDAVASDRIRDLIAIVLIAYVSVLAAAVVISSVVSWARYRRDLRALNQYHALLDRISAFSSPRQGQRQRKDRDRDERRDGARDGGRRRKDDLDYRHMQTLEFEDDEYSYYVEATPKRGGRRE